MTIFHIVFFLLKEVSNHTYKTFCALCLFSISYARQKNRNEKRQQQPLVVRDGGGVQIYTKNMKGV